MIRILRLSRLSLARSLKSPRFHLLVWIGTLVLVSECFGDLVGGLILGKPVIQTYSFAFMLSVELAYTVFPFIFAPICTLSGSLDFCEDMAHHFCRPVCTRISKNEYMGGRILSSALTGGLAGAAVILLSAVLLRSVYPAHTAAMQTAEFGSMPEPSVLILRGWGYVLKIMTAYFFGGMALSLAGLGFSALVPNRYVAIFAPLLLFTGIHFLMSYRGCLLTPLNLLMTYGHEVSLYQSAAWFTVACILFGIVFDVAAKRRLAGD